MGSPLPLPDSRAREAKNRVVQFGVWCVPVYCANCGCDGGVVPEENTTYIFYLCNGCADKHGRIEGTYAEPDAIFWEKVKQAQVEKYGRELTAPEVARALDEKGGPLALLAREKPGV